MFALVFALVVAASLVGCAAAPATGTPTANPASVGPTPTATTFGSALTCGGFENTPAFPAAALHSPPGAENDSDPAALALQEFLAPLNATSELPLSGWRRVVNSPSVVLFVAAGKADARWLQIIMTPTPAGSWQPNGYGPCQLEVLFGEGVGRAELLLDPSAPASPQATSVPLLVLETACSGGASPEGRIEAPLLSYRPDAVYVAITIRTLPGEQDCSGAGIDPYPFTLQLSEPLGARQLFDASVVPPKLVIAAE